VVARGRCELGENVGPEGTLGRDHATEERAEDPEPEHHGTGQEGLRVEEEPEPLAPRESRLVGLGGGDFRNGRALGEKNLLFGGAHRSAASRMRGLRTE
jgi:hypothetical protein